MLGRPGIADPAVEMLTTKLYIIMYIIDRQLRQCKQHTTGCLKKMWFCGKTAITTFKLIQNAKVGGVLENLGYLLK